MNKIMNLLVQTKNKNKIYTIKNIMKQKLI